MGMTSANTDGSATQLSPRLSSWRRHAACIGSGLAFVDADDNPAACLALCRQCPVRAECAAVVMCFPRHVGVMGGTTAAQRTWLRQHPTKAHQVFTECNELGIDADELSDWHTATGPVLLDVADRLLNAEQAATKHGVTLAALHRWLEERGCKPPAPRKNRPRQVRAGPWFEAIRDLLRHEAAAAPGRWIDQTRLADHLQQTLPASLIRDTPYCRRRGTRSTWTRYAHEVIRSGLRQGWIEQRPHPTKRRRRQVRFATDSLAATP